MVTTRPPRQAPTAASCGPPTSAVVATDTTRCRWGAARHVRRHPWPGHHRLRRPAHPDPLPRRLERPYGSYFDGVADTLAAALPGDGYGTAVERVVVDRGEMTLFVRREHLLAIARALRDDPALRFEMCTGVSGFTSSPRQAVSCTRSTTCSPSPTTAACSR